MTYGICVWVHDDVTGGEKVATRFPCSVCNELFEEIVVINDWLQVCRGCNRSDI